MIKKIILIVLAIVIVSSALATTAYADDKPKKVNVRLLKYAITKTDDVLMMKVKDGKLYILNSDRKAIKPRRYKAPADEVFYVIEVEYIKDLIKEHRKRRSLNQSDTGLYSRSEAGGSGNYIHFPKNLMMPACPPECRN